MVAPPPFYDPEFVKERRRESIRYRQIFIKESIQRTKKFIWFGLIMCILSVLAQYICFFIEEFDVFDWLFTQATSFILLLLAMSMYIEVERDEKKLLMSILTDGEKDE